MKNKIVEIIDNISFVQMFLNCIFLKVITDVKIWDFYNISLCILLVIVFNIISYKVLK